MSKALIERAFRKWSIKIYMGKPSYENDLQDAFIAGATWQREQLEAEIEELKNRPSDIEHLNKMSEQYSAEFHKALKQEREKRQLIKLELIQELREWAENEKQRKNTVISPMFIHFNNLLAKLDLLEKGGE
jgi:predicted RNase H-like nuclease (RuvC/YqgF family)